jgi:predicted phosphodiesterase
MFKTLSKQPMTYDSFLDTYELQTNEVKVLMDSWRKAGIPIEKNVLGSKVYYRIATESSLEYKLLYPEDNFKLMFVSDTHLGCKQCDLTGLELAYDYGKESGVKDVFHEGDLCDGINVYPGQINNLLVWGVDDMVDYVVDNYPKRKDMTTHFITGNHEEKVYKQVKVDLGMLINDQRDDLHYVGRNLAKAKINDLSLWQVHYQGSVAYSIGYRAQKYIRQKKITPDFLLLGHAHCVMYAQIQNTHAFECGTFQGENDYSISKGLDNQLAFWLVEINKVEDQLNIKQELISLK